MTEYWFVYTLTYVALVFDPNPDKEALNARDHGISFDTAQEVFSDPNQVIGMTNRLVLLLVVYVDRSDAQNDVIRIISARKAVAYEIGIYTTHSQG